MDQNILPLGVEIREALTQEVNLRSGKNTQNLILMLSSSNINLYNAGKAPAGSGWRKCWLAHINDR